MILCILGRQPELGLTELESLYPGKVTRFGSEAALVNIDHLDIQNLGGSQKAARVVYNLYNAKISEISHKIIDSYSKRAIRKDLPKLTIGISAYNTNIKTTQIKKIGAAIKFNAKKLGGTVRIIPNNDPILNTATSHHNKLGLRENKKEIIIIQHNSRTIIAESIGAQNITALAKRDQTRPKRDTFVGMLPPKLALMMYNMAIGKSQSIVNKKLNQPAILDPFCGTGVILQEAYLRGAKIYGTDLNPKMVNYTQQNIAWLTKSQAYKLHIQQGDATIHTWNYANELNAVICETYLGQPFNSTPNPTKLEQVKGNCNNIISNFLKNIHSQINQKTALCIAIPAWRDTEINTIHRLPLIKRIDKLGYNLHNKKPLLYFRENQIVARDILILTKIKSQ